MDKDNIIVCILIFLLVAALAIPAFIFIRDFIDAVISDYNNYKETCDFSTASVIDTHIGYSRFGTPCYYFVYKFSSGAIKQIEVQAEEYYRYLSENFPEGS